MEAYKYGPVVLWERTVQHALKNFCDPGSTILDLGANICGVSIALARLVGPRGAVHAFECNPSLVEWARKNIDVNEADNITLVSKAVFSRSSEWIPFYCEGSIFGHGSSLYRRDDGSREVLVETVSIDDYCKQLKIRPSAIKIDVEGAEWDALRGGRAVLVDAEPVVVFEDAGRHEINRDPMTILLDAGYALYDSASYRSVDRRFYDERPGVSNVLAIPPRLKRSFSYRREHICTVTANFNAVALPAGGRYVLECQLDGSGSETAFLQAVDSEKGQIEVMYETRLPSLKHHTNSNLVVDVPRACVMRLECGSQVAIPDLAIRKVEVFLIHYQ